MEPTTMIESGDSTEIFTWHKYNNGWKAKCEPAIVEELE